MVGLPKFPMKRQWLDLRCARGAPWQPRHGLGAACCLGSSCSTAFTGAGGCFNGGDQQALPERLVFACEDRVDGQVHI